MRAQFKELCGHDSSAPSLCRTARRCVRASTDGRRGLNMRHTRTASPLAPRPIALSPCMGKSRMISITALARDYVRNRCGHRGRVPLFHSMTTQYSTAGASDENVVSTRPLAQRLSIPRVHCPARGRACGAWYRLSPYPRTVLCSLRAMNEPKYLRKLFRNASSALERLYKDFPEAQSFTSRPSLQSAEAR